MWNPGRMAGKCWCSSPATLRVWGALLHFLEENGLQILEGPRICWMNQSFLSLPQCSRLIPPEDLCWHRLSTDLAHVAPPGYLGLTLRGYLGSLQPPRIYVLHHLTLIPCIVLLRQEQGLYPVYQCISALIMGTMAAQRGFVERKKMR